MWGVNSFSLQIYIRPCLDPIISTANRCARQDIPVKFQPDSDTHLVDGPKKCSAAHLYI